MDLLKEIRFQRLLSRYEKTFGTQPPIRQATVDEAIAYMSERLASCHGATGHATLGPATGQHA
jgi:hypothetical protein